MARPTKYNKNIYQKLEEYLESCKDSFEKEIKSESSGKVGESTSYEFMFDHNLPTKEGFALFIGVVPDTIQEWETRHPQFSVAMKRLMAEQKRRLVNGGLSGRYNPKITAILLGANHGTRENETPQQAPQSPQLIQNNYNLIIKPEFREAVKSFDEQVREIIAKDIKARRVPQIKDAKTTNTTED